MFLPLRSTPALDGLTKPLRSSSDAQCVPFPIPVSLSCKGSRCSLCLTSGHFFQGSPGVQGAENPCFPPNLGSSLPGPWACVGLRDTLPGLSDAGSGSPSAWAAGGTWEGRAAAAGFKITIFQEFPGGSKLPLPSLSYLVVSSPRPPRLSSQRKWRLPRVLPGALICSENTSASCQPPC